MPDPTSSVPICGEVGAGRPGDRRCRDLHETVAEQVDEESAAGSQHDLAAVRLDRALVHDAGREQHDIAPGSGGDRALIDDSRGGRTGAAKCRIALQESVRGGVRSHRDQAADIHLAVGPNTMPRVLTMKMRPFAVMLPSMVDFAPVTRLSSSELAEGCAKATVSFRETLNVCQLMTARSTSCVTRVVLPSTRILPD